MTKVFEINKKKYSVTDKNGQPFRKHGVNAFNLDKWLHVIIGFKQKGHTAQC